MVVVRLVGGEGEGAQRVGVDPAEEDVEGLGAVFGEGGTVGPGLDEAAAEHGAEVRDLGAEEGFVDAEVDGGGEGADVEIDHLGAHGSGG